MLLVIFLSLLTRYECLYSIHSHRHTYPSMRYAATQICQDESLHLKSGWELFSFCNFSGLLGTLFHWRLQTHLVSLNPCFVSLDNIILLVCFSHLAISSYRPKSEFYEILRIRFLHQNPMQGNLNSPFTVSMFTPTQKWLWEEKLCQYFESVCWE